MPATRRLKAIERTLTPKQIVLLDIQEWRRYPNLVEYARAMASGSAGQSGTLCERVEHAIQKQHAQDRGKASALQIREAQREALFLANLAEACTLFLAQGEEAIRLRGQLVAALGLLGLCAETAGEEWAAHRDGGRKLAASHVHSLRVIDQAVRLIETEYFDGHSILFKDAEAMLRERLANAQTLADLHTTHGRSALGKRPATTSIIANDARSLAEIWIVQARATVHDRMGEGAAALRMAKTVLGA